MSRLWTSFSSPLGLSRTPPENFKNDLISYRFWDIFLMGSRGLTLCLPEAMELRWSILDFVEFHKSEGIANKHSSK